MAEGADILHLEIATPERQMVDMQVRQVEVPCLDGLIGVLPGHAPLISILRPGVLVYWADHETRVFAVYGGFVEVLNDRVRVLADDAERKEDIDLRQAQEQLERATAVLAAQGVESDPAIALYEAQRAEARMEAVMRQV